MSRCLRDEYYCDRLREEVTDELSLVKSELKDVKEELRISNMLLASRQRVLEAIPQCKEHGVCIPHAVEWVKSKSISVTDKQIIEALRKEVSKFKSQRECAKAWNVPINGSKALSKAVHTHLLCVEKGCTNKASKQSTLCDKCIKKLAKQMNRRPEPREWR